MQSNKINLLSTGTIWHHDKVRIRITTRLEFGTNLIKLGGGLVKLNNYFFYMFMLQNYVAKLKYGHTK